MNALLIALIVLFALGTAFVLIKGIVTMAQGKDISGQQSNKLMSMRVTLQMLTIALVIILFIVGGAFAGLEKVISARGDGASIGFGAKVKEIDERRTGDILKNVEPDDLMRFGLIPEFIGRLPVVTSVAPLDQEALIEILTGPKNAFVKQYQRMFELDGAELEFEDEALRAIADEAHQWGLKVAAHAHGAAGIKAAIRAGIDTIEHASLVDAEGIKLAAARKRPVWFSMDIYNTEYILGEGEKAGFLPESLEKERRVGATQRENFRKAHQAGAIGVVGQPAAIGLGIEAQRVGRLGQADLSSALLAAVIGQTHRPCSLRCS